MDDNTIQAQFIALQIGYQKLIKLLEKEHPFIKNQLVNELQQEAGNYAAASDSHTKILIHLGVIEDKVRKA